MEPGRLKPEVNVSDAAASFQAAAIDMLVDKTVRAAQATRVTAILIAGGVSANSLLRQETKRRASVPVYYPPLNLCTDNAAMTAAAGYFRFRAHGGDALDLDVSPMLSVVANEHHT
jgi:N6-L-threonylcarbamoyladenine synthase